MSAPAAAAAVSAFSDIRWINARLAQFILRRNLDEQCCSSEKINTGSGIIKATPIAGASSPQLKYETPSHTSLLSHLPIIATILMTLLSATAAA